MGRGLWTLVVLAALGCGPGGGGCGASSIADPPEPVADAAVIAPAILAEVPRTDGGLPILAMPRPGGLGIALVYDKDLDDPMTRWSSCLGRVLACYKTNGARPVAGCIAQLERCPDDSGGANCCPPACIDAYGQKLAGGSDEETALQETFLDGTCVTGLGAMVQP